MDAQPMLYSLGDAAQAVVEDALDQWHRAHGGGKTRMAAKEERLKWWALTLTDYRNGVIWATVEITGSRSVWSERYTWALQKNGSDLYQIAA